MLTSYMLRSTFIPFHPNMNLKTLAFSHIAMDASSTQSVNILETFNAYQYRIYKLDNFHIFRFSRSGKGEIDVYRFMSKQLRSLCAMLSQSLSHLVIDASSCMKLQMNRMPLPTECATALLSFRYPSFKNISCYYYKYKDLTASGLRNCRLTGVLVTLTEVNSVKRSAING